MFISTNQAPPNLSPLITTIPQKVALAEERKAMLYNLASKVCLAGFLMITIFSLFMAFGVTIPLSAPAILTLFLAALLLQYNFQKYLMLNIASKAKANIALSQANELKKIENWTHADILNFFKEHQIDVAKIPIKILATLNPGEPFRPLLPLLASYFYWREEARQQWAAYRINLENRLAEPLRTEERRIGWHILEEKAIPAALQAAFALHTIYYPTLHSSLENLGTYCTKPFDQRQFDRLLDGNDDYFRFKDPARPPLTFGELQQALANLDITAIGKKLF